MLVLHFGDIRPHESGEGTAGTYALHIQCPWRFDGPHKTITGQSDLWEYAGAGQRPANWSYEDGASLQDKGLDSFIGPYDESTRSWYNQHDRLVVTASHATPFGDVRLAFSSGYALLLFPAGVAYEAWRLFAPGSDHHLVFPEQN